MNRWKVSPGNVNLLCWRALEKEESQDDSQYIEGDPSSKVLVSDGIMVVHRRAGIIAAERGQSVIEFNDLVEALVASRISAGFVHLYGADVVDLIPGQTRDIVTSIKSLAEEEFPLLQGKLDKLEKAQTAIQKQIRKIRYLGFALLAAVIAIAAYFGGSINRP